MRLPRNIFQLLIVVEAAALIAVIIFGAVHMGKGAIETGGSVKEAHTEEKAKKEDRDKFVSKKSETEDGDTGEESGEPKELEPVTFSEAVEAKLSSMTLEEKVSQMFFITPEALTHSDAVEVAGESTQAAVTSYPVGGLVYSSVNFKDKEQTREMLGGVQGFSNERIGLPVFLAVQECGGSDDSPLAAANGYDVQRSPSEIGAGGNPAEAAQAAEAIAAYLAEEGFNMNLMPQAETGEEGRCYGSDAQTVSMMAAEAVNGSRAGGIKTAAGTFPGKGAAGITKEGWTEWEEKEGLAFEGCISAGTDCMMLSNAACEGLTGEKEALCSMSKEAVYYLRNEMEYTGIIMTGSLSEEAVTGRYSAGEAAVEAVKSGVNMLYLPANFEEAYQAVMDAVNSGEIPAETIDQAAGYILTQKMG